jgi:hypothetical protein
LDESQSIQVVIDETFLLVIAGGLVQSRQQVVVLVICVAPAPQRIAVAATDTAAAADVGQAPGDCIEGTHESLQRVQSGP